MQIPQVVSHPLKEEVRSLGLTNWLVGKAIGRSDATVSKMLNGITPMPKEVEAGIRELLNEVRKSLVTCKGQKVSKTVLDEWGNYGN
jgi:hypothetical protein